MKFFNITLVLLFFFSLQSCGEEDDFITINIEKNENKSNVDENNESNDESNKEGNDDSNKHRSINLRAHSIPC